MEDSDLAGNFTYSLQLKNIFWVYVERRKNKIEKLVPIFAVRNKKNRKVAAISKPLYLEP